MTKQEKIGLTLGAICFLPAFISVIAIGITKWWLALILLIITQGMWLTSINLCTQDLEIKNQRLREKIKELEDNKK